MEDELDGQDIDLGNEGFQGESTESSNPAWSELLGIIPEDLHSQVTPHLSKWDQNYQNGITKVHSQYEPYKFLADEKVPHDQVEYAMSVLQAIESNPKEVLKALQTFIGDEDEQGQDDQSVMGSEETPEWLNHPEFKKMNEMVNHMAQIMVQQRESEQQSIRDEEAATEIAALHTELGDFDEEWVLTKMMSDDKLDLRNAVESYQSFEKGIIEKVRKPGPKILGAGGSVPNQGLDVKSLDSKGTRSLVMQMLENAQKNQ